jgi:hypothetical protein
MGYYQHVTELPLTAIAVATAGQTILHYLHLTYPPCHGYRLAIHFGFNKGMNLRTAQTRVTRHLIFHLTRGLFWSYQIIVSESVREQPCVQVILERESPVAAFLGALAFFAMLPLVTGILFQAYQDRCSWGLACAMAFLAGPVLGLALFTVLWILSRPIVWLGTPWRLRRQVETSMAEELKQALARLGDAA